MNSSTSIQTFSFASTRVNLDRSGAVTLSEIAHASRVDTAAGHTLGAFYVAKNEDLHPHLWEVHPGSDEVLLMCSGAIDVVARLDGRDLVTTLEAGHGLVVPKGTWHRLALGEPGLLISLVKRAGTRLCAVPLCKLEANENLATIGA